MGKNVVHSGRYRDGKNAIDVKLSLIEFEEDGVHFVYSPALDLTGYGKTEKEAENSYSIAMEEFIRYTATKDTIFQELKRLGWKVSKNHKVTVPSLPDLIKNREYLVEIFTDKEYRKIDRQVSIPAFA